MEHLKISCKLPCVAKTEVDYLHLHDGIPMENMDDFREEHWDMCKKLSKIIALKHSIFLLRNVSGMCESIPDSLVALKKQLIEELKTEFGYEFDEEWWMRMRQIG